MLAEHRFAVVELNCEASGDGQSRHVLEWKEGPSSSCFEMSFVPPMNGASLFAHLISELCPIGVIFIRSVRAVSLFPLLAQRATRHRCISPNQSTRSDLLGPACASFVEKTKLYCGPSSFSVTNMRKLLPVLLQSQLEFRVPASLRAAWRIVEGV